MDFAAVPASESRPLSRAVRPSRRCVPSVTDPAPGLHDPSLPCGHVAQFVTPAVTSPGIDDELQAAQLAAALRAPHPHVKYVDFFHRGYALLDVTPERVQCEWYHVATIREQRGDETLANALQVKSGGNHLVAAELVTEPAQDAPLLAPQADIEA